MSLDQVPVTINPFLGDSVIDWKHRTLPVLERLERDGHRGPVSIITRGRVPEGLISFAQHTSLQMIFCISVSGMPQDIEPMGTAPALESIRRLSAAGVPVIGFLRPIIPSINGPIIPHLLRQMRDAGCTHVVASGFRGDQGITSTVTPEEQDQWVLRVKLMSRDMKQTLEQTTTDLHMGLSYRVSCGVARVLGRSRSWNHYGVAPHLCGCATCPLDCGLPPAPTQQDIAALSALGYDCTIAGGDTQHKLCAVPGDKRLTCPSCCTCCYMQGDIPHITVHNPGATLGDLALARFVTGKLVIQKGVVDGPLASDCGIVRQTTGLSPLCINSWWVLHSAYHGNCFGCTYCISQAYKISSTGVYPSDVQSWLETQ